MLSILIFFPLLGALALALLPAENRRIVLGVALATGLIELVLALVTIVMAPLRGVQAALVEQVPWIPSLGISYVVGTDGISQFLLALNALLILLALATAPTMVEHNVRGLLVALLILETAVMGVFLAGNLFLFYIFWELMLIPSYFLVGIWGGPRRVYAALKFVLYTTAGSLLMLLGIIVLGLLHQQQAGTFSLNLADLARLHIPEGTQYGLFLAFFAAFAVKVPLVPFHSWLPDAYTEAPIPVTVVLSGVLSKTGAYGLLRFCLFLFPAAAHYFAPLISILAIISILYAALQALVQTDMKRLLAYSSISHLGFVILGIFALNPEGVEGGVLQMVNHGITTGGLFLLVGMLEARTGTRLLAQFSGLSRRLPIFAGVMLLLTLSSLGLPGLNSFSGEFLVLLGAFQANSTFGVLGTLGIILAAWYMMRLYQGLFQGPATAIRVGESEVVPDATAVKEPVFGTLRDLTVSDLAVLLPLLLLVVYLGVQPGLLPQQMEGPVRQTLAGGGSKTATVRVDFKSAVLQFKPALAEVR